MKKPGLLDKADDKSINRRRAALNKRLAGKYIFQQVRLRSGGDIDTSILIDRCQKVDANIFNSIGKLMTIDTEIKQKKNNRYSVKCQLFKICHTSVSCID